MSIKKITATTPKSILFSTEPKMAISVVVGNEGVVADEQGKKIIKAGTPVGGATPVFENRQTPLVVTNETVDGENAQGVVLHDVDVTDGNANTALLIFGYVNLDRLDVTPVAEAKTALAGKVTFIKE